MLSEKKGGGILAISEGQVEWWMKRRQELQELQELQYVCLPSALLSLIGESLLPHPRWLYFACQLAVNPLAWETRIQELSHISPGLEIQGTQFKKDPSVIYIDIQLQKRRENPIHWTIDKFLSGVLIREWFHEWVQGESIQSRPSKLALNIHDEGYTDYACLYSKKEIRWLKYNIREYLEERDRQMGILIPFQ
jgi:hypothetical protein